MEQCNINSNGITMIRPAVQFATVQPEGTTENITTLVTLLLSVDSIS